MTESTMTLREAAGRLGLEPETLLGWGEKLGVKGTPRDDGEILLTPHELYLLELIKALREEEAGFDTIRKRIGVSLVVERPILPEDE